MSALGWGTHSLAPLSLRGATYSGVFTLLPILDDRRFTFATIDEAHRPVEDGTARGKVVVDVPA